jgi:iron complex outermembrane receptor protein
MFSAGGDPGNVFGGKDGYGQAIKLSDGSILRRRDRQSFATLNQIAVEYRGRFLEDKVLVNLGARAPFFKRELNQNCYMRDTFNAYCTNQVGTVVVGSNDGSGVPFVTFPAGSQVPSATTLFGQPRKIERKYDKVLPNVGLSYDIGDHEQVYLSYAQTLSAPRTDDLYDRNAVNPQPEIADAYNLGWRWTSPTLLMSVDAWTNNFKNRVERQFDEAAGIFYSVNVGEVKLKGVDAQVSYKPEDYLSFYGSLSYVQSEIQSNFPNGAGGAILATKGKSLYEVPKLQGATRVNWDITDWASLGVQGKFVGSRWTNLTNTEKAPGYALWDLDLRFKLDDIGMEKAYLQFNVKNLFDEKYLADISTNTNGTAQFQPGYPRAFVATLHAEF